MDVSSKAGHDLLSFIEASPTRNNDLKSITNSQMLMSQPAFHAVHTVKQKLNKNGFKEIRVGIPL